MWKKAVVMASALVVAGSALVYAQERGEGGAEYRGPGHMGMMGAAGGWRPSADDMKAFADARIAALHAGLALNADQEKNWPPVEQALRDLAKMRMDRLAARREGGEEQPTGNPIERLQRRADDLTARGTALKHLADAAAPLYQSLDDAQKHRLVMLAHLLRPYHGMRGGMHERHGMMGRDRMEGHGGDEFRPYHDDRRMPGDGMRGGGMRDRDDDRGPL